MLIFLVGFMGSGKSTWGKLWAEELGYSFIDLDEQIEKREMRSITQIFEESGEDIFRLIETRLLRENARLEKAVIACGGGTPCFHDNITWMKEKGKTVYMDAPPTFLYDRLKELVSHRPLIKNYNESELLFFIEQTLKSRQEIYNQADVIVDATTLSEESLSDILKSLNYNHA